MKIISKEDFPKHKKEVIEAIKKGSMIIYPTDTIYGIGCDATNEESVRALRNLKERGDQKPFSIIAPNKSWIHKNCEVGDDNLLNKLPGPYTLILRLKNKINLAKSINQIDNSIGIRIPDCWFSSIVSEVDFPIVTTSVNISGRDYMKKLEDIPENFKDKVSFVIYDGEIDGTPSKKIDLRN